MNGLGRAGDLVRRAAQEVGAPASVQHEHLHAWRDAAVVRAVADAWSAGDELGVLAIADALGPLLRTVPTVRAGQVELAAVGVGERRRRGAFATPATLAAVLAARALPGGLPGPWPPTVVDPACGAGALLRAAFARLITFGIPADQAVACLHGVDVDAVAVEVCRCALAVEAVAAGAACTPAELAGRVVVGDALVDSAAFTWPVAFAQVLDRAEQPAQPVTGWRGGFGAVLANPPWERLKVLARDWEEAAPAGLREGRAELARAVREQGRHPLSTGLGELNAYVPFVETCWRLLGPDGRASVLTPAGVATDRSCGRLLSGLVDSGSLQRLQLLAPQAGGFEGVSGRVGVAVLDLCRGDLSGRGVPAAEVAVAVDDPSVLPAPRSWRIDPPSLRRVSPNTGTLPVCAGPKELHLLAQAHERWPVLRRRDRSTGAVVEDPWNLTFVTPLHMTRDAPAFERAPGPGLLPLWEAKHAGLLDPRGGGRRDDVRYFVPAELMRARYGTLWERGWLAGYRNVTTVDAPRTLLPTPLPLVGVGNSLPLLHAPRLPLLLTGLASLPVDFLTRCKHAGANLNFFKVEQIPLPRPQEYDEPAPWEPSQSVAGWLLARFCAAVVWDPGLSALAAELGGLGVDVSVEMTTKSVGGRRAALADIDAAHAVLLGWSRRDVQTVLATFAALRAREERTYGSFVTGEGMLAAYDRLVSLRDAHGRRP